MSGNKATVRKSILGVFVALLMVGSFFGGTVTSDEPTSDPAYDAVYPDYKVSDSEYLRWLEDCPSCWVTEEAEWYEAEDIEDPTAVESYNVATGEIIRIPSDDPSQQPTDPEMTSTIPFQGLLPPGIQPESVFPPDDRARITSTHTYPWRTICKLQIGWSDGATGGCSGAIIGAPDGHGYHVLTAGHCVYSHSHGGWASYIKILPGLDHDYMPYNYAWATLLRSYTGWTVNGDHRYDWAMITLDRNVGDYTGWMGRMTAGSGHSVYTGILNTAGYPCNTYHATKCPYPKTPTNSMWWDADYGRTANENNHWYYMDTQAGQSGSPVWVYYTNPEERYILTIHAYGDDGSSSNHGTRLNNDKFDRIITWCNEDTPPTDYADLIDDGQLYSGFTPTSVQPGATVFDVWCDVRNIGTASSGGFYVSYYASTNDIISEYDYLIGTDYVSSISPFNWRDSEWNSAFPTGIPDGTYYVGWIIDSSEIVTEFDETNNVGYKDSYTLLIDGTLPSASIVINGGATHTTTTSVTLSLTYSDSGSGVDECRYGNLGGSWTPWEPCTPTKAWELEPGDGEKTVFYQVKDNVGNIKEATDTIILDTNNPPYEPADPNPIDGATDVPIDADLSWTGGDPDDDNMTYDVHFGTDPDPPQAETVPEESYDPGTLEYATSYYWKIIAHDDRGKSTEGPIWQFTTEAAPPDLDCDGELSWTDVEPGSTVEDSFTVSNIGEPGSLLDWRVREWPTWGNWTFTPIEGNDQTPEDGPVTVQVSVEAPNEQNTEYTGEIRIVNMEDSEDSCIIQTSLVTPRNKHTITSLLQLFIQRLCERFPLLELLLHRLPVINTLLQL
jgi:V8-like Glu-specific endopeptidase